MLDACGYLVSACANSHFRIYLLILLMNSQLKIPILLHCLLARSTLMWFCIIFKTLLTRRSHFSNCPRSTYAFIYIYIYDLTEPTKAFHGILGLLE